MRWKRKPRLSRSGSGHIAFVGRQPGQCQCLFCRSSMVSPEQCKLTIDEVKTLCRHVVKCRNWRAELLKISEREPDPDEGPETALYQIAGKIGLSGIKDLKITADVASDILKGLSDG